MKFYKVSKIHPKVPNYMNMCTFGQGSASIIYNSRNHGCVWGSLQLY